MSIRSLIARASAPPRHAPPQHRLHLTGPVQINMGDQPQHRIPFRQMRVHLDQIGVGAPLDQIDKPDPRRLQHRNAERVCM